MYDEFNSHCCCDDCKIILGFVLGLILGLAGFSLETIQIVVTPISFVLNFDIHRSDKNDFR